MKRLEANPVQLVFSSTAAGLSFAAYRVADVLDGVPSDIQFHLTYDNTIYALVPERIADKFCDFLDEVLGNNDFVESVTRVSADYSFLRYTLPNGQIEYQIRAGDIVLAVMLSGMARLFYTMVRKVIPKPIQAVPHLKDFPPPAAAEPSAKKRRIKCPAPQKKTKSKKLKRKKK